MRKITIEAKTQLSVNTSYEAEPLEDQLEKLTTQQQPIEATSPIIYTERKEGVKPEYDIRTDRWEIAQEAMEKVHKTDIAKRDNIPEKQEKEIGKAEPTQGTETT